MLRINQSGAVMYLLLVCSMSCGIRIRVYEKILARNLESYFSILFWDLMKHVSWQMPAEISEFLDLLKEKKHMKIILQTGEWRFMYIIRECVYTIYVIYKP